MSIHRNAYGNRRAMAPTTGESGTVKAVIFEHILTTAVVAASDIIEIGVLPAGCVPISASFVGIGMTASATADVGFMTGLVGEDLDEAGAARTSGDELFDATPTDDDEANAAASTLLAIPADHTKDRSIGVKLSANESASTSKKLRLLLHYIN